MPTSYEEKVKDELSKYRTNRPIRPVYVSVKMGVLQLYLLQLLEQLLYLCV